MQIKGVLTGSAALVAISALVWLAGEQHRENCIRELRTSCSVLPWQNGQPRVATVRPVAITPDPTEEGFFPKPKPGRFNLK